MTYYDYDTQTLLCPAIFPLKLCQPKTNRSEVSSEGCDNNGPQTPSPACNGQSNATNGEISAIKPKLNPGWKSWMHISWYHGYFFVFHMLFVFPMLFLLHSLKNIHLKFALQQACWCLTNFTASAAASSSIAYGINKVPLTHALLILWLLLGVKLLVSSHVSPPSISQKDPLNPSSHVFCASLCTAETMDDGHDENPNLMWSLTEAWELNSKPTFSNKIDLYIHHSK